MPESLAINADSDDISLDFLPALEAAFGLKLSQEDVSRIATVGDLYDVLLAKMSHVERGSLPCASAVSFYRLRRAFKQRWPDVDCRPDTPLAVFIGRHDPRALWRFLEASTGYRLPRLYAGWITIVPMLGLFTAPGWAFVVLNWRLALVSLAGPPLAVLMGRYPFRKYIDPDLKTVGDLAKATAAHDLANVMRGQSALRRADIWASFEYHVRRALGWRGPLTTRTRFFAE